MAEKPKSEWTAEDYFNFAATGKPPPINTEEANTMRSDNGDFAGLDYATFKKHPIRKLLDNVQNGYQPNRADVYGLGLPVLARERLMEAIDHLQGLRSEGEMGAAHNTFGELAADVVALLPSQMREPAYFEPAADEPDDPEALALRVPRW